MNAPETHQTLQFIPDPAPPKHAHRSLAGSSAILLFWAA